MAPLALIARAVPGGVLLELTGELDISTAPRVEEEIARLELDSPPVLVLDLRGLEFMDSTGLRIVVAAHARAEQAGRRLQLVRPPEAVHRLFRLTRLDERLDIVDSPPASVS